MKTEIEYGPAFATAKINLDQGESVQAGAGVLLAMSPQIEVETSARGGVLKGLKRSVLGGASFFQNTFTATGPDAHIIVAPALAGDIVSWPLEGATVYLQSGAYLAAAPEVTIDTEFAGTKSLFGSGGGFFALKCHGFGEVLVSTYGAIYARDLAAGEQYVVDTGYLLAWSEGVSYDLERIGNWKSTLASGEGLVSRLTGPGRIYIQTRSQRRFIEWLLPFLPDRSSS